MNSCWSESVFIITVFFHKYDNKFVIGPAFNAHSQIYLNFFCYFPFQMNIINHICSIIYILFDKNHINNFLIESIVFLNFIEYSPHDSKYVFHPNANTPWHLYYYNIQILFLSFFLKKYFRFLELIFFFELCN